MLQYNTTAQGALLDPEKCDPLFATPAYASALSTLAQLARYSPPLAVLQSRAELLGLRACDPVGSAAFVSGRCAMTTGWGGMWKVGGGGARG